MNFVFRCANQKKYKCTSYSIISRNGFLIYMTPHVELCYDKTIKKFIK